MQHVLREDYFILKNLIGKASMHDEHGVDIYNKLLLKMGTSPLLVVDSPLPQFNGVKISKDVNWYDFINIDLDISHEVFNVKEFRMPFEVMSVMMDPIYTYVYQNDEEIRLFMTVFDKGTHMITPLRQFVVTNPFARSMDIEVMNKSNLISMGKAGEMEKTLVSMISKFIYYLSEFFKYQNNSDRRLVTVDPIIKKKAVNGFEKMDIRKRLRARSASSSHIIYLNSVPVAQDAKGTGAGGHSSKTAHARKGYSYTLKHERYSKHPKYQIEKAMWRKSCYIGELESDFEGNTYRVLPCDMDGVVKQ